ncbi:MAG: ATP-binding protein [Candidatus Andeanibacterium colombiense]|uniref:histidine kinase n=1 Tax=Candidatus Andeanibacterium colombiense TaxID=3121345 RepID=A0AAJ5X5D3_9SPHN|nr:MAG: ATP-binding protein [Sphingomonadaceae bacterium]
MFAAFTLATGASFLVGSSLVQILKPNAAPLVPQFETPVRIAALIETGGVEAALPLLRENEPVGRIVLVTADGKWVAGARDIDAAAPSMAVISRDGLGYRLRVRPSDVLDPNRTMPLIIGALVSLFFSAGVAWYLARPLAHLSKGFRDIAAGRLSTRLQPVVGTRRDEIADLTREFDSMAGQLQQLLAAQERLLHDISHELRSPLARLQVAIGLFRQAPDDPGGMLARVDRETERLGKLIEEILTLARLKSGMTECPVTRVDVIDLLTAIVDDANFEAQAKGCEVSFNPSGSFVIMAYGELLYRAYENVIRNAVKFSPENARIEVSAKVLRDRLEVRVADQGPGVPQDMLTEIFEPFKGAYQSEAQEEAGFGLGLAIAKNAAQRHGGTIHAVPCPKGGLLVEISIPRVSDDRTNLLNSSNPGA